MSSQRNVGSGAKNRSPSDPVEDFDLFAQRMAEHVFGVMKLYCMEYSLTKEHVAHAVARLCISIRNTYPDGPAKFDELAGEAQVRLEREGT